MEAEIEPHYLMHQLTSIDVFDVWNEPDKKLPLFGAICMVFKDSAHIFKSPLRYRHARSQDLPSYMVKSDLIPIAKMHLPIICDLEQLVFHKNLLKEQADGLQRQGWKTIIPESRNSLMLDHMPYFRQLVGQDLLGITRISEHVMELRFTNQAIPFWLSFRDDLDGSLQLARAGYEHNITEVVITEPANVWGWLHPDAPCPISVVGNSWLNVSRYVEEMMWLAKRGQRNSDVEYADKLLAMYDEAVRVKFDCFPQLARRFAAIRYPIVSTTVDANFIQALNRLRVSRSINPAS